MKRAYLFIAISLMTGVIYAQNIFLAGTDEGLFRITAYRAQPMVKNTAIKKIIRTSTDWFFLTDKGIMKSRNLQTFAYKNAGFPVKVLKTVDNNGKKTIRKIVQPLKDLEVDPGNPDVLVTATNSTVFLTRNAGETWESLGTYGNANGLKAVAVTSLADGNGSPQLTVFVAHALYGFAWKQPDVSDRWIELTKGLVNGPQAVHEVSDIAVQLQDGSSEIYLAHTFVPKLFRLNWQDKQCEEISGAEKVLGAARCIDGLAVSANYLVGVVPDSFFSLPLKIPMPKPYYFKSIVNRTPLNEVKEKILPLLPQANCAWVPAQYSNIGTGVSLSELWLLNASTKNRLSQYAKNADKKKGIYIPSYQIRTEAGLQKHFQTIRDNNLNMLVIDMKDEQGLVRYDAKDPLVQSVGAVRPHIQLESFVKAAKAQGIYLVARIVTFKDRRLYRYKNGAYAVRDAAGGRWQGFYWDENGEKEYRDEHWVDPYNEHVWEYTIAIAKELVARGFDEIQFDYIRFPTDGSNIASARYPGKEAGMDKESALMSFLAYARSNIDAPISIDIYGANGWWRTGARTGQEVELLADYVDVICPMFYPNHFAQDFLAYPPARERPYRIYYHGSYQNKCIARNKVIVRSWAQAFYLPVSYDRKYYDKDYVLRQILGIADSIDEGYMYWNNSGRYTDILPDGTQLKK